MQLYGFVKFPFAFLPSRPENAIKTLTAVVPPEQSVFNFF
jgi:hypothetical protein